MSVYKVVSESQIKRLRQLGYQIVPIAGTVLVPGAAEDTGIAPAGHNSPGAPASPDPVSDNPKEPEASPASILGDLEARHRGNGSYSVMRGDEELVEGLNKHDAAVFNATNADGKAAYLAARGVAL